MDRGKPRSKMHILSDSNGLPLVVGVSPGNTHDSEGLKSMVEVTKRDTTLTAAGTSSPSACTPTRRMTDPTCGNGCVVSGLECGSPVRESGPANGGRRRWVIERTMSWLSGYRRLSPRYERDYRNYLAFLGLAAAICCYKRYVRLPHGTRS